jgi:hypothetical protein
MGDGPPLKKVKRNGDAGSITNNGKPRRFPFGRLAIEARRGEKMRNPRSIAAECRPNMAGKSRWFHFRSFDAIACTDWTFAAGQRLH